jgi:signal transduction histidine kinase
MTATEQLAQQRNETVLRLLRAGAWVAIVLASYLMASTVFSGAPAYPVDAWARPGAVLLAAIIILFHRHPLVVAHATTVSIACTIAVCLAPAASAWFGRDFVGNAALMTSTALAASALFPWGSGAQGVLAAAILALIHAIRGGNAADLSDNADGLLNALTSSLIVSVLIARRTRRVFEAAVIENLALRTAERQIRELNAGLEATVAQRTGELENALADQRSFARAVSHDIRQPLRHIDGYLRRCEEKAAERLGDEERDLFSRAYGALARVGRMIDSLLELSRLGLGAVRRNRIDVSALARDIAGELAAARRDRKVAVEIDDGMVAEGDPYLLRLLLFQLLDNAWKFTRGRGDAQVRLGRSEDGSLFVADNGVGFSMEHAHKLFGTFERLHGAEEFSGEGIGLAAAARIVRHHGGRIWAESEPGRGATFYFTLEPDKTPLLSADDE